MFGFGIIGCGMISSVHAGAIAVTEGAELRGVTDVDVVRASDFAQKYKTSVYRTIEDMLCDGSIDALCICIPSGRHASVAVMCANAGKHVVIEKPMALTVDSAEKVIAACKEHAVTGTVISQMRYSEDILRVREAILNGIFGKIISAHLEMYYYRTQDYYDSSGWRGTWAMDGGGALMNQGIHGVDALNFIMGGVETVTGTIKTLIRDIEVEDTAAAVLSFKNGSLGTINASVATYPGYPRKIKINGERGCIILTEHNVTFCDVPSFGEVIPLQSIISGSSDPSNTPIYGHAMQFTDFIEAVKTGGRTRSDIRDGRDTIKIIESIYKSSQNGMRILL